MINSRLGEFGAYQKSRRLFDFVAADMEQLNRNPLYHRVAAQQIASADSVCANMEEGYGRESAREYRQFLIIARGSLRETQGRYDRLAHRLGPELAKSRIALCEEISRILSATIRSLCKP